MYCTPCESFWTESQLVDGKCPDCGRECKPCLLYTSRKIHIDGVMSMIKVEHANKTFSGKYGTVHALQLSLIHIYMKKIFPNLT